jgi:capsular polysaccharide biosynthesis protein
MNVTVTKSRIVSAGIIKAGYQHSTRLLTENSDHANRKWK